ncbi:hypothetical protein P7K49_023897 [Saguinus oedipus]|uniref:Uncharacterized protein n=1 Tax=Saguinus oedipus TaxID=9490 RepID=A0ABQ9UMZ4_SAGOE|nr:hypothetical protein P7K49_023897 [Saguinus oedipus]
MGMPDRLPNLASASASLLWSPLTSHACWALANSQEAIAWGLEPGSRSLAKRLMPWEGCSQQWPLRESAGHCPELPMLCIHALFHAEEILRCHPEGSDATRDALLADPLLGSASFGTAKSLLNKKSDGGVKPAEKRLEKSAKEMEEEQTGGGRIDISSNSSSSRNAEDQSWADRSLGARNEKERTKQDVRNSTFPGSPESQGFDHC